MHKRTASVLLKKIMISQDRWGLSLNVNFTHLAKNLIEHTWKKNCEVYDFNTSACPHKITTAAISLVYGIDLLRDSIEIDQVEKRRLFIVSLDAVCSAMTKNVPSYPLTAVDREILAVAIVFYNKVTKEVLASNLMKEIDLVSNKGWASWYRCFVKKYSELNTNVCIDNYGMSIIDLMDHKPFKKFFYDGASPETVAIMLASK